MHLKAESCIWQTKTCRCGVNAPKNRLLGKEITLIFLGKYKPHILSLFWKYGINRFLSRVKSNKTKEKSEAKALLLTHINEVGDLSASGLHDPE